MRKIKAVSRLCEHDLSAGTPPEASWHQQYAHSAYIFIGNLDLYTTEPEIAIAFSQWGEIVDLSLAKDSESQESKGFAFLAYEDQRSTVLAIDNFNGIRMRGRQILVDHVDQYKVPKHVINEGKIYKPSGPDGKGYDLPDQAASFEQPSSTSSPDQQAFQQSFVFKMSNNQQRMSTIVNKPGNRDWADCHARNPRWTSINLGVIVWIQCAGFHRALGVHISKMKSCSLDAWQEEWFQLFEQVDNQIANALWEEKMPADQKRPNMNSPKHLMERFLRDKYELKKWKSDSASSIQEFIANYNSQAEQQVAAPPVQVKASLASVPVPAKYVDLLDDVVENQSTQLTNTTPAPDWTTDWTASQPAATPVQQPAAIPTAGLFDAPPVAPVQQTPMFSEPAPIAAPAVAVQQTPVFIQPTPIAAPVNPPSKLSQVPPPQLSQVPPPQLSQVPPPCDREAQRQADVSKVMSMYSAQPTASAPDQQAEKPKFVPAGALAAQQLNQHSYGSMQPGVQPQMGMQQPHMGMQQAPGQMGMMQQPGMQAQIGQPQMQYNQPQPNFNPGQYRY